MTINYYLFVPLIPFVLGLLLKALLDFNLAIFIVKFFYWIPMRAIFRIKVHKISGKWQQTWINETSVKYPRQEDTTSEVKIRQFGKYCYAEFGSLNGNEHYYLFGEVLDKLIIGKWADRTTSLGYFGSFELRIVNNNRLEGIWLGHSNEQPDKINSNQWLWTR